MDPAAERYRVVGLAVAVEGGLIVAAEILGRLLDRPPGPLLHWEQAGSALLWGVGGTVPMLLLFGAMLRWPIGPLARVKRLTVEILCPMLAPCSVVDLLGISALAGLGEEMFFRGVVQAGLQAKLGFGYGLLAASILFGFMHAITFTYALFATLMGAYLGWLWHESGNLLAAVVAHALYDFLALLFLVRVADPGGHEDASARPADNEKLDQGRSS